MRRSWPPERNFIAPPTGSGFSLVEMLASMAVLVLILLVLFQMTDAITRTWKATSTRMTAFSDARGAFDQMTKTLSQAVLNTYVGYDNALSPTTYQQLSELQFLSLPMSTLADAAGTSYAASTYPTHAVFFEAPTGLSSTSTYTPLSALLNAYGFFIEFGDDASTDRPTFLTPQHRYRYRLMEWVSPSDRLTIYAKTSGAPTANPGGAYTGTDWIDLTTGKVALPQTLAENVIALVINPISPTTASSGTSTELCSSTAFTYNSRGFSTGNQTWQNQLPPEVEVIMVAIDEPSAVRLSANSTGTPPAAINSLLNGPPVLFTTQTESQINADLATLGSGLSALKINYVVLRSTVKIREARWSQ